MLTSDSLIKVGKYKNKKRLNEISIEYFRQFYVSHGQDYKDKPDIKDLMEYIEITVGIKSLRITDYQTTIDTVIKNTCPKEFFINESDAKYRLDFIRKMKVKHNGKNKIPVRAYECDRCGYWHLTSQPKIGSKFTESQEEEIETYTPTLKDAWLKLT